MSDLFKMNTEKSILRCWGALGFLTISTHRGKLWYSWSWTSWIKGQWCWSSHLRGSFSFSLPGQEGFCFSWGESLPVSNRLLNSCSVYVSRDDSIYIFIFAAHTGYPCLFLVFYFLIKRSYIKFLGGSVRCVSFKVIIQKIFMNVNICLATIYHQMR